MVLQCCLDLAVRMKSVFWENIKTRIPVLSFLSIAQFALINRLQSYSVLPYFPCEHPNTFLEHKLFGNASLLPVPSQVQILCVASLQGRDVPAWSVNLSKSMEFCSLETKCQEACLQ